MGIRISESIKADTIGFIILFSLLFLLFESAWADEYCIRDVGVPHATKQTLFGKDSNVKFPDNKIILPQTIRLYDGITSPLISEMINIPTERERYSLQTGLLLWGVNEIERELLGPFHFEWIISRGSNGVNRKDNTLSFVGGRNTTDGNGTHAHGSDKTWQTRIFTYDFKSPPKRLDVKLEQELQWPRIIFWSEVLGGYLITSVKEKEFASTISRTYLLKDSKLRRLELRAAYLLKDLPDLNLVAVLDTSSLYFLDSAGNIVGSYPVNAGDDYGGWEDIYRLKDNWLYVSGAQYDHVLKFEQSKSDGWSIKTIYRIVEADGANNFLMWLFGARDKQIKRGGLTDIFSAKMCRHYSPVTKHMFFCGENAVLQEGRMTAISESVTLDWYVGDVERLGISLFWGKNNKLFGFDGDQWSVVAENIERGILEKPDFGDRVFYTTIKGESYELVGEKFNMSMVPLNIPDGDLFTRFLSIPNTNKVFVFTRNEISILDEGKLSSLEKVTDIIHTTGHAPPNYIPSMKGILFSTGTASKHIFFKLLDKCD